MAKRPDGSLKYYHFAATLLAIAIASLATYLAWTVQSTTAKNYTQTQCNQGLLILATMDYKTEGVKMCSSEIRDNLKRMYP